MVRSSRVLSTARDWVARAISALKRKRCHLLGVHQVGLGLVALGQRLRGLGACILGRGIGVGIGQRDRRIGGGSAEHLQVALGVGVLAVALHRHHADLAAVGDQRAEHRRQDRRRGLDVGGGRRIVELGLVEQGQLAVLAEGQHRQRGRVVERVGRLRVLDAILDVVHVIERIARGREQRHAEGVHRQQRRQVRFQRRADGAPVQAAGQVLADVAEQAQRLGRGGEFGIGALDGGVGFPTRHRRRDLVGDVLQQVQVGLVVGDVGTVALHDDQPVHAVLRKQRRAHPAVEVHHAARGADLARGYQRLESRIVQQPRPATADHQRGNALAVRKRLHHLVRVLVHQVDLADHPGRLVEGGDDEVLRVHQPADDLVQACVVLVLAAVHRGQRGDLVERALQFLGAAALGQFLFQGGDAQLQPRLLAGALQGLVVPQVIRAHRPPPRDCGRRPWPGTARRRRGPSGWRCCRPCGRPPPRSWR